MRHATVVHRPGDDENVEPPKDVEIDLAVQSAQMERRWQTVDAYRSSAIRTGGGSGRGGRGRGRGRGGGRI